MIGQHQFVSPEEWDQQQCFQDLYDFLMMGIGLDPHDVTIHEDAWAGGGNFGLVWSSLAEALNSAIKSI